MSELIEAKVINIFTCPEAGMLMQPLEEVKALAGIGLENDRYAIGTGAFSNAKRQTIRQVSLAAIEAINTSNKELEVPFTLEETRRNIITEGIDLNELVGVEFAIGDVAMRGVELCTPCGRPNKLSGKTGFQAAFDNRGGLRAEILNSGLIQIGSLIEVPSTMYTHQLQAA